MPQIFHRSFNVLSKLSIFGAAFLLAGAGLLLWVWYRSPYVTGAYLAQVQPVPFSHQHHVGQLGIDCRYCHTSVEDSAFAGMPPTKTCMNCHQEIWFGSPELEPVRASYRTGQSIPWVRVHRLPDFAYFNHGIHVRKGVGCVACHGRVDQMPLLWQEKSLLMEWCLDCHRRPEQHLRPRSEVFSMTWEPANERDADGRPHDQRTLGRELAEAHHVRNLTSCSTCHR